MQTHCNQTQIALLNTFRFICITRINQTCCHQTLSVTQYNQIWTHHNYVASDTQTLNFIFVMRLFTLIINQTDCMTQNSQTHCHHLLPNLYTQSVSIKSHTNSINQ